MTTSQLLKPWPGISLLFALLLAGCNERPAQITPAATSHEHPGQGIVVDNGDRAMVLTGSWQTVQSSSGYAGDCAWAEFWRNPLDGALDPARYATATVRPELPEPGMYEVYAWSCDVPEAGLSTKQLVWLCASRGYSCVSIYINPRENAGEWNSLGTYYLEPDGDVTVRNGETRQGGPPGYETIADGAVVLDAFRFVYRSPKPSTLTPAPWQPLPSPTP